MFYTITITISVIDRSAPFQTRLSAVLSRVTASIWANTHIGLYFLKFYGNYVQGEYPVTWIYGAIWTFLIKPILIAAFQTAKYLFSWVRRFTENLEDQEPVTGSQRLESRCIVHLLERTTVSEDLNILAEAVNSLPDNLGASEIAAALSTFHLKPTRNDGTLRFPGLQGQSWRAIVKIIGFVLGNLDSSEMCSLAIQFGPLQGSLQMRDVFTLALWDALLAHPEDQEVYSSTCRTFLTLSHGQIVSPSCFLRSTFIERGRVVENLAMDGGVTVQERTFRLVCLLPSIGCDLDATVKLLRTTISRFPQLGDTLKSTMWEVPGHYPELEIFCLATLRVEILSSHHLDRLVDSHFPEYLAAWFNHFAIPDWNTRFPQEPSKFHHSQRQRFLYWTYLFSLRRLLRRSQRRTWSQELVTTGHLSCLRVIVQDYVHDYGFGGEPLGLWALLCLWNQERSRLAFSTNPFLIIDCVQLVNKCVELRSHPTWITKMADHNRWSLSPTIWTSEEKAAEDVAQMLDWLFSYLEAAKQGGLINEDVAESTVQAYSCWWTEVNQLLPQDQQHRDRSDELRTVLLGMNRLNH